MNLACQFLKGTLLPIAHQNAITTEETTAGKGKYQVQSTKTDSL